MNFFYKNIYADTKYCGVCAIYADGEKKELEALNEGDNKIVCYDAKAILRFSNPSITADTLFLFVIDYINRRGWQFDVRNEIGKEFTFAYFRNEMCFDNAVMVDFIDAIKVFRHFYADTFLGPMSDRFGDINLGERLETFAQDLENLRIYSSRVVNLLAKDEFDMPQAYVECIGTDAILHLMKNVYVVENDIEDLNMRLEDTFGHRGYQITKYTRDIE